MLNVLDEHVVHSASVSTRVSHADAAVRVSVTVYNTTGVAVGQSSTRIRAPGGGDVNGFPVANVANGVGTTSDTTTDENSS